MIALMLLALASSADVLTTLAGIKRGAHEVNWLYGKHPSAARLWTVKAVTLALAAWCWHTYPDVDAALYAAAALTAFIAWRNTTVNP